MKKIGILGGMGPEATAELYLQIIRIFQQEYGAVYDNDYPEILICSLPLPDIVEKVASREEIIKKLTEGLRKLEKAGADFVAIPCNTVISFLSEIKCCVSIPIVNIVEETLLEIEKTKLKKVGLLATELTTKSGLYLNPFPEIEVLVLPDENLKEITQIIIRVLSGKKNAEDIILLQSFIKDLQDKGAEKVILGCTELPLLIPEGKDTLNTINILARSIVRKAINI